MSGAKAWWEKCFIINRVVSIIFIPRRGGALRSDVCVCVCLCAETTQRERDSLSFKQQDICWSQKLMGGRHDFDTELKINQNEPIQISLDNQIQVQDWNRVQQVLDGVLSEIYVASDTSWCVQVHIIKIVNNICQGRNSNAVSASFRGAFEGQLRHWAVWKAVPIWRLLQMLLLFPVFGGRTTTILRGLTYPKILCVHEKEERENGDIARRRSSLSQAWAAEIVT